MTIRAILFDLDGTLLDTLEDLADSMNAALASVGHPGHPVDAYKKMVGDGVRTLAIRALPEHARHDEAAVSTVTAMRTEYASRWKNKTRPYPGIPELLDQLTARKLPMAVFSNKPHDATLDCVRELLPAWTFARVLGQKDPTPKKPAPDGALLIAAELNVSASECLYLGDTDTDMQTATAAGMFAVGVTWGFRDEEELRQHGAKAIVHHPLEVLSLIESSSTTRP